MARRFATDEKGGLKITMSTFNVSGDYMCTAVNVLGRDEKTAKLIVEDKKIFLICLLIIVAVRC